MTHVEFTAWLRGVMSMWNDLPYQGIKHDAEAYLRVLDRIGDALKKVPE